MEVVLLRTFLAVADVGSFRGAAVTLSLSQPAVSLQVQRLEAEVGTPLFDRHARGATLTAAGERLLDPARRLVEDAVDLVRLARQEPLRGTLVLGVQPGGLGELTLPMVRELRRRLPRVDLRVVPWPLDQWTPEPEPPLDAAFVRDVWGAGARATCLTDEPLVVGVAVGSPWADAPELRAGDVAAARFVALSSGVPRPVREFYDLTRFRNGEPPRSRGPGAREPLQVHRGVVRGDGVGVGPALVTRWLPTSDLYRAVPLVGAGSSRTALVSRGADRRELVLQVHRHAADVARRLAPLVLPEGSAAGRAAAGAEPVSRPGGAPGIVDGTAADGSAAPSTRETS